MIDQSHDRLEAAKSLLTTIEATGGSLYRVGGNIRYKGPAKVVAQHQAALEMYKPEFYSLLTSLPAPAPAAPPAPNLSAPITFQPYPDDPYEYVSDRLILKPPAGIYRPWDSYCYYGLGTWKRLDSYISDSTSIAGNILIQHYYSDEIDWEEFKDINNSLWNTMRSLEEWPRYPGVKNGPISIDEGPYGWAYWACSAAQCLAREEIDRVCDYRLRLKPAVSLMPFTRWS